MLSEGGGRASEPEALRLLPSEERALSAEQEECLVDALAEILLERLQGAGERAPSAAFALLLRSGAKEER